MIKRSLCFVIILLITMNYNSVNASKSDIYKNMLETNQYTLIYRNETQIKDNENELRLFNEERYSDYLEKKKLESLTKGSPGEVTLIANEKCFYKEMNYTHLSECQIEKDNLCYVYSKLYKIDGSVEYYGLNSDGKNGFGLNKNKITPQQVNNKINYKRYFTDPTMDRLLSPLLPENIKRSNLPKYKKIGENTLINDYSYEDYVCQENNHWEIMRYYFQNDNFIKIAAASYDITADGKVNNYKKIIMKICEFTNKIDYNKFILPLELEINGG